MNSDKHTYELLKERASSGRAITRKWLWDLQMRERKGFLSYLRGKLSPERLAEPTSECIHFSPVRSFRPIARATFHERNSQLTSANYEMSNPSLRKHVIGLDSRECPFCLEMLTEYLAYVGVNHLDLFTPQAQEVIRQVYQRKENNGLYLIAATNPETDLEGKKTGLEEKNDSHLIFHSTRSLRKSLEVFTKDIRVPLSKKGISLPEYGPTSTEYGGYCSEMLIDERSRGKMRVTAIDIVSKTR